MNVSMPNASAEIQQAICEIVGAGRWTTEEVIAKAIVIQRLWRLRTVDDGIMFLLEVSRLDLAVKSRQSSLHPT